MEARTARYSPDELTRPVNRRERETARCAPPPSSSTPRPTRPPTCETADRLVRAAAADGAELVVLPEKWTAFGTADDLRARRRAARRARRSRGRAASRASSAIDLVAGSISERVDGEDEAAQHLAAQRPRRRAQGAPTARSTCSTSRSTARVYRESDHEEPGDETVLSDDRRRRRARADRLLRPALPRALPRARRRGARILTVPAAFTLADDARPLGGPPARPRDREPGVRRRRQPDRRAPAAARARAGAR